MLQMVSRKTLKEGYLRLKTMAIVCENTFRVIKPQNPLGELLPTIPQRVLWKTFKEIFMTQGLKAIIFENTFRVIKPRTAPEFS